MTALVTWEEFVVDFSGTVAGISGHRVICGTVQQARDWIGANAAAAGQIVVTKRQVASTIVGTYGLPGVSPPPPPAPTNAPPTAVTGTHIRIGVPNVPQGFVP